MNNKFFFTIIILFLLLIFVGGCTSSNHDEENHYRFDGIDSVLRKRGGNLCAKLIYIDSTDFKEYYCMLFTYFEENNMKLDSIDFYVLSEKDNDKNINLNLYENFESNKAYCLGFFEVDTIISAKLSHPLDRGGGEIILIRNIPFWSDGKFVAKVYFSNDIMDKYVLKDKRKTQ
jgi:hypothetical protein